MRVEHWDNAIRQGKLAAAMLGHDVTYDWQPYFFTDQFEFSMGSKGTGRRPTASRFVATWTVTSSSPTGWAGRTDAP
ncbi:MAG: hypothetical protein R2742_15170 [Micropruina glycogenica]